MYQFKDEINYCNFFRWDKMLFKNKNWARLSKASQSAYPVIACHCDKEGNAFPGEQRIAIMSGRSDKNVRDGISGLEEFPNLKIEPYITNTGKRSKKFIIQMPPIENGSSFNFYKSIIEGGNWRELKPTGKALYPVMRCFSFFEKELYLIEGNKYEIDEWEFKELYKLREFDFCNAEYNVLAEYAGINIRSIDEALSNLHECGLIEKTKHTEEVTWKVYLHPSHVYKPSYLNRKINETYHYLKLKSVKKYRS